MGHQIGCINHHGLLFAVICRQADHHLDEDAFVAPPLPTVVECLVWPVLLWGISPEQAIAVDKIIPLKTRLSSTRGLPWDLGK